MSLNHILHINVKYKNIIFHIKTTLKAPKSILILIIFCYNKTESQDSSLIVKEVFMITLEQLQKLDKNAYQKAIQLKGVTKLDPTDIPKGKHPGRFEKIQQKLKKSGHFSLTLWVVSTEDHHCYCLKTIDIKHWNTNEYPFIGNIYPSDHKNINAKNAFYYDEDSYIFIENGCLLKFSDLKVIAFEDLREKIDSVFDLIIKHARESIDWYEGRFNYELSWCGKCDIGDASEEALPKEDTPLKLLILDLIHKNLQKQSKKEQQNAAKKEKLELESKLKQFEERLIKQNTGFNPNIKKELYEYKENFKKFLNFLKS